MEVQLYAKLKEKKIPQKQLAEQIGISEHAMCNKMQGRVPFLYREVVKICKILDIENPLMVFETEK